MHSDSDILKAQLTPDYFIPRVVVGAWQFSEGHNVNPAEKSEALNTLSSYTRAGLSTFDCADIYTGVEELLGELVRSSRYEEDNVRDKIQVHTKFVPDRDSLIDISKKYTEQIIDRSLQRLGKDQLDLVQFAWWDYGIPGYVEAALWLNELKQLGKVRNIGLTNFDVPRLREIVDAGVPIVSHQIQYSLFDHRPERGMVNLCRERNIQILCYGTLAGGFLSDRWLGVPEPTGSLPNRSLTKYKLMIDEFGGWESFQKLLYVLREIATKHGVTIGNVATRYVLELPQVAAVILGARSTEFLDENLRIFSFELDEEDINTLRDYAVPNSAKGDVFSLEREPKGKHASIMRYNLNRG